MYLSDLFLLLLAMFLVAIYLLPFIVAMVRGKRNCLAILVLNLLLGWTLIGWVVALVWACMIDSPAPIEGTA